MGVFDKQPTFYIGLALVGLLPVVVRQLVPNKNLRLMLSFTLSNLGVMYVVENYSEELHDEVIDDTPSEEVEGLTQQLTQMELYLQDGNAIPDELP